MDLIVTEVLECIDNVIKYMRINDNILQDDTQHDLDVTIVIAKQACNVLKNEIELQNITDDKYITTIYRKILKELIIYSIMENKLPIILSLLIDFFDNNHDIIAEMYLYLCDIEIHNEKYEEALNFAGEALSHRIKYLGLLHNKTADSHYKLGLIYMKLNDLEQSRKQFLISRQIRCIGNNGYNLLVADCDIQLGFIITMTNNKINEIESPSKYSQKSLAYNYFYSCFRTRNSILGFNNNSTQKAYEYVLSSRHSNGKRYISSLELKDSIQKLKWISEESSTFQYRVALYITQLGNEEILDLYQLKSLIAAAIRYSFQADDDDNDDDDFKYNDDGAVDAIAKYLLLTAEEFYVNDSKPKKDAVTQALNEINNNSTQRRKSSMKKNNENKRKSVHFTPTLSGTTNNNDLINNNKKNNNMITNNKKNYMETHNAPIIHDAQPKTSISSNNNNIEKKLNVYISNNDLMAKNFPWLEENNMKDVYLPVSLGARTSMIAKDLDGKRLLVTLASNDDVIKNNSSKINAIGVFNLLLKKKRTPDKIPQPPPLPSTWPPTHPYHPNVSLPVEKTVDQYKKIALDCISDIDGTIWSEQLDSIFSVDSLFSDMVEEFINNFNVLQQRKKSVAKSQKQPKAKSSYLENAREQNISIMLTKFGKRHVNDICKALLEFNTDFIGLNSLTLMTKYLPDAQDIKAIEAHMKEEPFFGVPPKLSKAEEYLLGMSKIPLPLDRILAMCSCLSYSAICGDILKNCSSIIDAVREIQESARFKYLLRAFLELYNALQKISGDTNNEGKGFRLTTSLSKLNEIKTNSGDSVEYYVSKSLFNLLPEALDLKRDFPTLDAAKNISFQKVAFDIKKLEEDLHRLEAVRKNEKNSTALDRISIYVDQMTGEYTNVSLRYKQAQNEFNDFCSYLGEDRNEPEILLPCLNNFINNIDACKARLSSGKGDTTRANISTMRRSSLVMGKN